jgi:hypothetical protein
MTRGHIEEFPQGRETTRRYSLVGEGGYMGRRYRRRGYGDRDRGRNRNRDCRTKRVTSRPSCPTAASRRAAAHHRIIGDGKLLTNERTNPYLVEIPVAAAGLDIALNRQIVEFHKSRHIQLRHGRSILRYGETYYRWCFRDSTTARAFVEQFGGALHTHSR